VAYLPRPRSCTTSEFTKLAKGDGQFVAQLLVLLTETLVVFAQRPHHLLVGGGADALGGGDRRRPLPGRRR
jgi:hypothetical protein